MTICPTATPTRTANVTGVICELPDRIIESLGLKGLTLTYRGYKGYDEMIAAMAAGEIDVAFPVGGGLYYSELNGIYQSNPVVSAPMELVFKGKYHEPMQRIAVNENNSMQRYYVMTHLPELEIVSYPSIDDCLAAVMSGEVDSTTLNGLRANDILKNSKYSGLSMRQLGQNDNRCFGVPIGNEGLLKLLNHGVNAVGSDDILNATSRYSGELYTYTLADFVFDNLALVLLVTAIVVGLIIFLLARDAQRSKKAVSAKEAARLELEEKNAELVQSRADLSEALIDAERANRSKTTFLSSMSHDIRTPMNAIVGFTALAESSLDDPERMKDYLGKIEVSSQHLLTLINDVLDMSRIESGAVHIEEAPTNLQELVDELASIARQCA